MYNGEQRISAPTCPYLLRCLLLYHFLVKMQLSLWTIMLNN
ncbi:hypothetical protein EVA_16725 [gut metagenome]|uniref:Uncharacterized protein n=1 Tax=gut metagenome TaxID=749906 RepID=J9FL71_9ZZZZ